MDSFIIHVKNPSEKLTMKAVIWEGKPYETVVREVPRPTIESPTDIIVRVTTAAICGSDLHNYHGLLGGSDVPFSMGHEAIGIVDQEAAKASCPILFPSLPPPCLPHTPAAEYVRVIDGDSVLFSLPQGTEHELDYLTCADIFATAWTSITQTGFQPGDTVAVYGAGPVGLLAAYSSLFRGAKKVYSIDHVEARLARAESIGAIPIDLRRGDPSEQILKLEPNGVPRVSDCVGMECVNPSLKPQEGYILNDAVRLVAERGGIALTGAYLSGPRDKGEPRQGPQWATVPFDIAVWFTKGATINGGSVFPSQQEPTLKDLITAGRVRPGFVFDHIIDIDQAPEAYRLFSEHKIQKAAINNGEGKDGDVCVRWQRMVSKVHTYRLYEKSHVHYLRAYFPAVVSWLSV
ncbi:hypothetical protein V490_07377 [Pseudogymnoascus sp. VKM F-3557]|nr:hypothetical protein V490_07377 [Pseudogymnoascus sp. VKM F-3557]